MGKVGSAEAAYATYLEVLPPGDTPDQSLADVMHRVRLLRSPQEEARSDHSPPFVGRIDALTQARAEFDRVQSGGFSFVLIKGEAGIGKTRLLRELERDGVLRDFRCLWASPVEFEKRIPLNPILDALAGVDLRPHLEALGAPWSTVISTALPAGSYDELVGDLPQIQESGLSRRLLDAFSLLFERLALDRPTVLFLDDLQWADATTLAVLQFCQRRWTEGSFGIVASVSPERVKDGDPAAKYLTESDGLDMSRIELTELSQDDGARLVAGIAEREIDDETTERLCALAGLHPLYLTELTRDFLAGHLKLSDVPPHEVTIPISLRRILRSRITNLSDHAMRVARVLAVGGRAMRLGVIATLSDIPLDDCADSAEELQLCRL